MISPHPRLFVEPLQVVGDLEEPGAGLEAVLGGDRDRAQGQQLVALDGAVEQLQRRAGAGGAHHRGAARAAVVDHLDGGGLDQPPEARHEGELVDDVASRLAVGPDEVSVDDHAALAHVVGAVSSALHHELDAVVVDLDVAWTTFGGDAAGQGRFVGDDAGARLVLVERHGEIGRRRFGVGGDVGPAGEEKGGCDRHRTGAHFRPRTRWNLRFRRATGPVTRRRRPASTHRRLRARWRAVAGC